MNKKVMAVAVAGALALPAAAMAQVTISGGFRAGVMQHSIGNITAAGAAGSATTGRANAGLTATSNTSETRVFDNVTQIIFQAREDLGGGLTAVGRYEWRPTLDGVGVAGGALANGTGAATNFVGFESKTMGKLLVGSVNTYAGNGGKGGPYTPDRGIHFTSNVGITQQIGNGAIAFQGQNSGLQQLNFGQGRQTNSVTWNSPNWNGFNLAAVWSSQNSGSDADLAVPPAGVTATARKGNAYIIAPGYANGPFSVQYIYFNNEMDGFAAIPGAGTAWNGAGVLSGAAGSAVVRDVEANKLWATYDFTSGLQVSGMWSRISLTNAYSGAGAATNFSGGNKLSEKTVWTLGGKYSTGPHTFTLDYTRADDDKYVTNAAGQTGNTGVKHWATSWIYEFSKRTEVVLNYAKFTNDNLAANGPQDNAANALGATGTLGNNAGESYTIWGANLSHKF